MKALMRLFFMLLGVVMASGAGAASIRVSFDVPYQSGFFSDAPSAEFRSEALARARQEVWKAYLARLDSTKVADIERNRAALDQRLDDILTDLGVLDEQVMSDAKRVRYTVRATVNDVLVDTLLAQSGGGAQASGAGSLLGFLFVPRAQAEVKEFDAKVSRTVQTTGARSKETTASDRVKELDAGIEEKNLEGTEEKVAVRVVTSGSTTRKAQEASWTVVESKGVDAEVTKVFTENGYEAASFHDILAECGSGSADELVQDLVDSGTLNFGRQHTKSVTQALKECEVRFFGVGFLDIDSIQKDDQTGGWLVRVNVNVNVKDYGPVLDGTRRIASTVATVQEFSSGIGRSQEAARDSALKEAGHKAATIVMSQMRAKGLR